MFARTRVCNLQCGCRLIILIDMVGITVWDLSQRYTSSAWHIASGFEMASFGFSREYYTLSLSLEVQTVSESVCGLHGGSCRSCAQSFHIASNHCHEEREIDIHIPPSVKSDTRNAIIPTTNSVKMARFIISVPT